MSSRQSKKGTCEKLFQVESILERRERVGRVEYLLKWKGCPESENTWEPEDHLNCPELLERFKELHNLVTEKSEQIVGAARMNSEVFYLIKRRGQAVAEFVPSRIAAQSCPQLIIDFHEQRYAAIR